MEILRRTTARFALAILTLAFATISIAEDASDLVIKANAAAGKDSAKAVELLTKAIKLDGELADAFYLRGRENFRLGKFNESLADFDKYVELRPANESRQWERGITMYYAKKYQRGADQFKLYQTYHDNDVENSTWRYLCMAQVDGVDKARKALLPIKNDPRVPMMKIYELYKGTLQPKDVLAACEAGEPTKAELSRRLFYTKLYLGLYFEANGKADLATRYLLEAADNHKDARVNRYMYDVARVHAELLRKAKQ